MILHTYARLKIISQFDLVLNMELALLTLLLVTELVLLRFLAAFLLFLDELSSLPCLNLNMLYNIRMVTIINIRKPKPTQNITTITWYVSLVFESLSTLGRKSQIGDQSSPFTTVTSSTGDADVVFDVLVLYDWQKDG